MLNQTDPDISFKLLMKDYMELFNEYFPKQLTKVNKKNHNWFDEELKNLQSNKEVLFKKYMQTKSPETKNYLQKLAIFLSEKFNKKTATH